MPESAKSAERKRAAREAARRREAAGVLRIAEATCRYAASQLGNGIDPAEARETAAFVAGELAVVAEALRRLTRLGPAERRVLARQLVGLGWSKQAVAVRLGVSDRTVRGYFRPGTGRAGQWGQQGRAPALGAPNIRRKTCSDLE